MLAQVEPVQAGGAGGRGQGQEAAVGDHGHLVAATGQEVSEAHLDVLAGALDEGDVLAVDDPG